MSAAERASSEFSSRLDHKKNTYQRKKNMQNSPHWILKDFLTFVILVGIFYNMQEGRDGNPLIRKVLVGIENWYEKLNTRWMTATEEERFLWLREISRRCALASFAIAMAVAMVDRHFKVLGVHSLGYFFLGSILLFGFSNEYLMKERYVNWGLVRWGSLIVLAPLVAGVIVQLAGLSLPGNIAYAVTHIFRDVPASFTEEFVPIILGGALTAIFFLFGLICMVSVLAPRFAGVAVLRFILWLTARWARFIAWLDPKRNFAWFMFWICFFAQMMCNHL
jgi:hypothetical protein